MGLLISRPSVFVWEPEACLLTVSVVFVERRPLRMKTVFAVASIVLNMKLLTGFI